MEAERRLARGCGLVEHMPRNILPGKPYPQGATWDGTGVNFSLYSERATGVELCFFDELERGAERGHPSARSHRRTCGTATSRRQNRPTLRLSRSRSLRPRTMAIASIPPNSSSILTPRRWPARPTGMRPYSVTRWASEHEDFARTRDDQPRRAQGRRHHALLRLGERPPSHDAPARNGALRAARARLYQAAPRTSRRSCAAPMPASATP